MLATNKTTFFIIINNDNSIPKNNNEAAVKYAKLKVVSQVHDQTKGGGLKQSCDEIEPYLYVKPLHLFNITIRFNNNNNFNDDRNQFEFIERKVAHHK